MDKKRSTIKKDLGNFDIVAISETWLDTLYADVNLHWQGKSYYRIDRTTDRAGGLVCYISQNIFPHTALVKDECVVNDDIESLSYRVLPIVQ